MIQESIEARIVDAFRAHKWTLATAESCTGGLIGHRITNVAGSSACFLGGIIAYANAVKASQLAVPQAILDTCGAVSKETADAMVRGLCGGIGCDWGVAVTGIAGPGGGTAEKPVGLVYIATMGGGEVRVTRNLFNGSREAVKAQTADAALTQLWEHSNL